MAYGSSGYGSSEYGGSAGEFFVASARAVNAYTVQVSFSSAMSGTAATLNPANYDIPGVTITNVVLDPEPNNVRLICTLLDYITYERTVGSQVKSA